MPVSNFGPVHFRGNAQNSDAPYEAALIGVVGARTFWSKTLTSGTQKMGKRV